MRKIYTIFALICLCAIFLTLTNYYKDYSNNYSTKQPDITMETYVLKSNGESVNLYFGDSIIKTYQIPVSTLPETDRDNLKTGIVINSYEDALSLIEDFDG